MNIAIFGWYHHRNAGDDRMQDCITRWLDGHCLAFLPAGRPPPIALLRTYDAAIIGGGSIVNPNGGMFKDICRWVRKAGIPVGIVSVTLDGMTPELRHELRAFFDLDFCSFAWFRDQESVDLVGPHPKVFAAPDITWLYPFPIASPPPAGRPAIAVCLRKSRDLPVARWRKVLAELSVRGHDLLPWPLYFENGGDGEVLRQVLPSGSQKTEVRSLETETRGPAPVVPDEFGLVPVCQADVVLSGRFHGVLFALQTGRPVIAVSSLPKTRRFLADNGMAQWCVPEEEPERLLDLWPEFVGRRQELAALALSTRQRLCNQTAAQATPVQHTLARAASVESLSSRRRVLNRLRCLFR